MSNSHDHYDRLFRQLIDEHGPIAPETVTGVIGFSAGGPVSMRRAQAKSVYVTCELSLYPLQRRSTEGLKYELMSQSFTEEIAQDVFTALGALSMEARLGHGHTIDIGGVLPELGFSIVQLKIFSKVGSFFKRYGIYEVSPVEGNTGSGLAF